jgi:hypothetical protein
VSQLIAEGLPVGDDGRIDVETGWAWIAQHVDPDRRRGGGRAKGAPRAEPVNVPDQNIKPTAAPGLLSTVANLRGHKLAREAQLLELALQRKRGELVDRAEAEAAIFARARQERDAWLAFSSRAAAVLAAEAGVDPGRSFPVLDRIVREHLAELAATPLKLI